MKIHPTPPPTPTCVPLLVRLPVNINIPHPTPTASQPHLCAIPRSQPTLCASLLSRNELGHFTRATLCGNSQENAGAQKRDADFASLRSRNALGHFTRATSCGNLQEKCPIPEPRRRLCASLRSRNALGHFTSHFIYAEICRKNARSQNRGADFVRACAVETRLDISRAILFMRKFAGQMHDPRTASRNEFGHCVRATSCKNLQVKCRGSAGAPGSSHRPLQSP